MTATIEATGLTKRFGATSALDGLDLRAEAGQVTALLGPNGAGKTTFVRMLASLVRPDAGSLTVAGIDALRHPAEVRRAIGLAGQAAAVEGAMTGRENLELVGRLFGHDRRQARASAEAVLDQLGLAGDGDRLVRTYSGGMRRRLDLGATLVGAPRLLLLDEPTTGLDPRSRNDLWDVIRDLVAAGTDVLLTTQHLDEADHLADQVVIIDHGRAIAAGSPEDLKDSAGFDVVEVRVRDARRLDAVVAALAPIGADAAQVDVPAATVTFPVDAGAPRLLDTVRVLDGLGVAVSGVSLRRASLDEVFLALTGTAAPSPTHVEGHPAVGTDRARRRRRAA
jgi:ABC-2 type transport system ATP-binding protein